MRRGRYGRSYHRGYRGRPYYSSGLERARQHIEDARRLSEKLGGADQQVKEWFFTMPAPRLTAVLDAYQERYGRSAREYAEQTIGKWRSGQVAMSGMVAERLFDLLPPLMPPRERLALTERLWRHFGPTSCVRFRVGLDADATAVIDAVERYVAGKVQDHTIPDPLKRQFAWLSAGDVTAKQVLLNHIRDLERQVALQAARECIPMLLAHMRTDLGSSTQTAAQTVSIGKHNVTILLDRGAMGIREEDPQVVPAAPRARTSADENGWMWVVGAIIMLIAVLSLAGR